MNRVIRIGTRGSELALWQAHNVRDQLEELGYETEVVPVKSTGDIDLKKPLYAMGITGIFTKALDIAMITGQIDIAVHSMKDVPTLLPEGIVQGAVLPRASAADLLVYKDLDFLNAEQGVVATGSLRRKAQWLNRFPSHKVVNLRGNVNTRLRKLNENEWNGAIFASAGLERIHIKPENAINLDWMLPAPAQGIMLVAVKEKDDFCKEAVAKLNDSDTEDCVAVEREFLRVLEGGCTAPIGALATIEDGQMTFKGNLLSLDGTRKIEYEHSFPKKELKLQGEKAAKNVLSRGGDVLMQQIKQKIA